MQKNQLNRRGITLVETLIVLGIIATLVGILWLAIGPRALVSSRKAAISAGLKQATAGLAMYRGDNNDAFPGHWDDFGFSQPNTPKDIAEGADPIIPAPIQYPKSWMTENGWGPTEITYLMNSGPQFLVSRYTPRYPFDEQLYPVFSANFFTRVAVEHGQTWTFVPPNYSKFVGPGREIEKLAGFTDGHVAWHMANDLWEQELMYRSSYGDK